LRPTHLAADHDDARQLLLVDDAGRQVQPWTTSLYGTVAML
jgi:hypothetical protein